MKIIDRKKVFRAITDYTTAELTFLGDTKGRGIYSAVFVDETGSTIYLIIKIGNGISVNTYKGDENYGTEQSENF